MNKTYLNTFLTLFYTGIALFNVNCSDQGENAATITLFTEVPPDSSGIHFVNSLTFDNDFNIFTYRNYYNGGGVAIGDINNDGLVDAYLTSNLGTNRLFLNKGNFRFDDVTDKAGVAGARAWSTGAVMADVNGDGWLDVYVCNSGDIKGDDKENELFINNGDMTFTERASEYGIADPGYTTHAAFFDYDKDGDLDLYVLNNSYQAIGSFNLRKNERTKRDALGGDKLMRNDGNFFTDASEEAGIYGRGGGGGRGVSVGDVNTDGWQDIFVSNDFFERDYLYINNKDGTFTESLTDQMRSISNASMGADFADINNDGILDLFVTDMLPKDNERIKTVTTFEDWNRYQYSLENDYYHQFTRNVLHLNNGDNTFSEIGRLSGVEATDWSWGALIFDMDNDGFKDIFVANGIYQDLTNQDFLQYASNEEFIKSVISRSVVDFRKLTEIIPSNPVANCAFQNQGDLTFSDKAEIWGLAKAGFSNGSAYGDLDNDGDLDLIVNNVNMPCFVYRNNSNELHPGYHYLKIELIGKDKNTDAIGARVTLEANGMKIHQEQMPARGFQSTVDHRLNFGLGNTNKIDRLTVNWPSGSVSVLDSVRVDQSIELKEADGIATTQRLGVSSQPIFERVLDNSGIDFYHEENDFVDFDRDQLLFCMVSTEGPRISKGDVNGDTLEDFFIGGAKNQAGAIYVQLKSGGFLRSNHVLFDQDKASEDMGSEFFDADDDGDLDLYVCSGGTEFSASSTALFDRLYINDGAGIYTKSNQLLPTKEFESTSVVKAADYDNDGDVDLFVGVRFRPFFYGLPTNGYILENDGNGSFTNVASEVASSLTTVGMITDAVWSDIDLDGDPDLIVVGEYMPIKIFVNQGGILVDQTERYGLQASNGLWNRIEGGDLDNDGDMDFVVVNNGLNSRFKASDRKPMMMYINDFDENGTIEQIICTYNGERSYPMVLRHDLIKQLPALKKKYIKFEDYKDATITDIFSPEQLKEGMTATAYNLESSILISDGDGKLAIKPLPVKAQFTALYGVEMGDFDSDGKTDILLGGNLYKVKPEIGRYDGDYGLLLKGDGKFNYEPVPSKTSGIMIDGEVRDIVTLNTNTQPIILISRNNNSCISYIRRR